MIGINSIITIILVDTDFNVLTYIDDPLNVEFTKIIDDIDSISFSLHYDDSRVSLFSLDCLLVVSRMIPDFLDSYTELICFYRSPKIDFTEDGKRLFTAIGVGKNDLLARRIINYQAGTIKSSKNAVAETAMKEYVEENCGASATIGNERQIDGVIEDFVVDTDLGKGITWEGDRSYENLLEVLKDISKFSSMDFDVELNSLGNGFIFKTFENQLGLDRTVSGLDPSTGLNSSGNRPFVFSIEMGNVSVVRYSYDRVGEANVVSVLGEGELSTRDVVVRQTTTISDSKWNQREVSRAYSGSTPVIGTTQNELETAGDEILNDMKSIEIISIDIIQTEACIYARDFLLGDKVSIKFLGTDYDRRITSVKFREGPPEKIILEFGDDR